MPTCHNCGEPRDGADFEEPCPGCGVRVMHRSVSDIAGGQTQTATLDLVVTKASGSRPWHQRWEEVQQLIEQMRHMYANGDPCIKGPADAERLVNNFFVACDHMADWLAEDTSAPAIIESMSKGHRDA